MLVLLVARAAFAGATLGLEATLAVCGARGICRLREDIAIPNLLALVDPTVALPHVVLAAGRVAAGPMLVLLEASAAFVGTTLGLEATLAVCGARTLRFFHI